MNRTVVALAGVGVLVALSPLTGLAETLPLKGARDARVRVAEYHADEVYRLPAFVGYQVHLEFEPGESFVGLGAGDVEGVSFVATGNHLFLKPKAAAVTTNLTVVTDRREYQFEYSATTHRPNPEVEDVIYSLRFAYPPVGSPIAPALAAGVESRAKNFAYGFCGPRSLQPTRAWDDGVQTYMVFPARVDLPAVFVMNADGTESLVNITVEVDQVRVHRVTERLILRRGRQVGCLVNRAFSGGGSRLESGTVAPRVVRRTREATP
jgi:type IV secretion system protein VirB9